MRNALIWPHDIGAKYLVSNKEFVGEITEIDKHFRDLFNKSGFIVVCRLEWMK